MIKETLSDDIIYQIINFRDGHYDFVWDDGEGERFLWGGWDLLPDNMLMGELYD